MFDNIVIVLVSHGKSNDRPHNHAVKLFTNTTDAEEYCKEVTDTESKHYVVAEIVENGVPVETDRDGYYKAFSRDWL